MVLTWKKFISGRIFCTKNTTTALHFDHTMRHFDHSRVTLWSQLESGQNTLKKTYKCYYNQTCNNNDNFMETLLLTSNFFFTSILFVCCVQAILSSFNLFKLQQIPVLYQAYLLIHPFLWHIICILYQY